MNTINNQILKTLEDLTINFKDIRLNIYLNNVINDALINRCKTNDDYNRLVDILGNNGNILNLSLLDNLISNSKTDSYEKIKSCLYLIPKIMFIAKDDLYSKEDKIYLNPFYDNFKSYEQSSGKDTLDIFFNIRKNIIVYKSKFFDEDKLEELLDITSDYIIQILERIPKGEERAYFLNSCDFYQNKTDAKLLRYYNQQNFENNSYCSLTKTAIDNELSDKFIDVLKYKFATSQLDFNENLSKAQTSVLAKGNDDLLKSIIFKENGLCNISLNKDGIIGIIKTQCDLNNLRSFHISIPVLDQTIATRLNDLGYYSNLLKEFLGFIKENLNIQQFEFKHIELLNKDFCNVVYSCFRDFLGSEICNVKLNDEESIFFLSCVIKDYLNRNLSSSIGPRSASANIIKNSINFIDNNNLKNIVSEIFSNEDTYKLLSKIWPKEDNITTLHFMITSILNAVKIKAENIKDIYNAILSNLFENKQMFNKVYSKDDSKYSKYFYNSLLDTLNEYTSLFKVNFFKKQKVSDEMIDEVSQNKKLLEAASKNSCISSKTKTYVKLCLSNL